MDGVCETSPDNIKTCLWAYGGGVASTQKTDTGLKSPFWRGYIVRLPARVPWVWTLERCSCVCSCWVLFDLLYGTCWNKNFIATTLGRYGLHTMPPPRTCSSTAGVKYHAAFLWCCGSCDAQNLWAKHTHTHTQCHMIEIYYFAHGPYTASNPPWKGPEGLWKGARCEADGHNENKEREREREREREIMLFIGKPIVVAISSKCIL